MVINFYVIPDLTEAEVAWQCMYINTQFEARVAGISLSGSEALLVRIGESGQGMNCAFGLPLALGLFADLLVGSSSGFVCASL